MRIEQLQYILEVAKTGSISLAAKRLHLSQPSISQAILALEEELGIKIFKRSKAGAQPTQSGKAIITKAQEAINKMEELKEIVDTQHSLITGRLTIASIHGINTSILPKTLASYKEKYPGIEVNIIEEDAAAIERYVLDGKVDLGLTGEFSDNIKSNKQLICEDILSSNVMACVGKDSPLAQRSSISLSEIIKHPVICATQDFKDFLNNFGQVNYLFKSKNLEAAKQLISQGVAVGFYTEVSLKNDPYIITKQIVPLKIVDEIVKEISYCLIHLKSHRSIARQMFLEELRDQTSFIKRLYNL